MINYDDLEREISFDVTEVKAEYSSCGSHRLRVTATFSDQDDLISFIAELMPQLVALDMPEYIYEHYMRAVKAHQEKVAEDLLNSIPKRESFFDDDNRTE
jgi:hypothetical protein